MRTRVRNSKRFTGGHSGAEGTGLGPLTSWVGIILTCGQVLAASEAADLRLVPFPKEIHTSPGRFALNRPLTFEASQEVLRLLGLQLREELERAGLPIPELRPSQAPGHRARLVAGAKPEASAPVFRTNATAEDYCLNVEPDAVVIEARGPAGLGHGIQTLRQLIRANRRGEGVPCLTIRDWPSLKWRAFQDDLTRGPSSTLENLREQAALGAYFKMNVFTYYMEHQYAFAKHPVIGPPDGSLTPNELKALVAYAQPLHLNILGNQQSFGHFTAILAHPEYGALRETPYLLCPTNEATYRLLDDLYSEVIPLLPFEFFNVCCDETDGLGQGPSKPVAERLGVGGLYAGHIQRLHALVSRKYGKRMMMWGDIILRHPDKLKDIPKDVVMLSWGYDPRASFEDQILPFARSGFDFFVCPGVNCWNRVLPHFSAATTNISHFVRDGAKHGALGMLNTAWDDDGENFNAPNWHGLAWGAECAWNASTTSADDFNRRLGAVLFGESGEQFGLAIGRLSVPGIVGLPNAEFWKLDFGPVRGANLDDARAQLTARLEPIREAMAHLRAARQDAKANAGLLDFFLFGAERIAFWSQRDLDRLGAVQACRQAIQAQPAQAEAHLAQAVASLQRSRQTLMGLRDRFIELWLRENKPYALGWTLGRYKEALARYDQALERLIQAQAAAKAGLPLPSLKDLGLE